MVKIRGQVLGMQDMSTRLLSANLDFDSRLQHVSCCVPDEWPDSRVFHVDPVFLCFWSEPRSHVWSGCDERFTWLAVFDENTCFSGHGMLFSWIPRKLSSPWYRCYLVDSGGNLLNTLLGASLYFCCLLFTLLCLSQCLERYRED